jgi:hypothetical protein
MLLVNSTYVLKAWEKTNPQKLELEDYPDPHPQLTARQGAPTRPLLTSTSTVLSSKHDKPPLISRKVCSRQAEKWTRRRGSHSYTFSAQPEPFALLKPPNNTPRKKHLH